MSRKIGTVSRGVRCPIIREGDDMAKIVVDSVIEAAEDEGFALRDRDVVAVTESVVARAQGNYASVDAIAKDVKAKLGGETIGVIGGTGSGKSTLVNLVPRFYDATKGEIKIYNKNGYRNSVSVINLGFYFKIFNYLGLKRDHNQ